MKLFSSFIILCLLSFVCLSQSAETLEKKRLEWDTVAVNDHMQWMNYHSDDVFSSRQSIQYLAIDIVNQQFSVDICYLDSGRELLSKLASQKNALAAINGTFFDTRKGGAVVFLKVDGEIISPVNPDAPAFIQEAAFAASDDAVFILEKPTKGWESVHQQYQNMMVSGPLLIKDGQRITLDSISFNNARHPRSALCLTEEEELLMIAVDGRHENQAAGMTMFEMVALMEQLQCHDAFNLDGGGSTTLWLKAHGVINHPSDNKKFDHQGARKIANGIIIKPN